MTTRGAPITIATAHGVIEVHRVEGDRRKLEFILPPGLVARVGMDSVKRSSWLDVVDGKITPKHRALEPEFRDGEFAGLKPPETIRVRIG